MKLIQWPELDAYYNLAVEEYVFTRLDRCEEYLLLWQNRNAVVIGKHQNAVEEINSSYVREHDVQVARRLTGGGAVYHDLGNLNYSFIVDAPDGGVNFKALSQPVADVLIQLGAEVQFSHRNDLLLAEKKISGNAEYIRNGRMIHHGTLLFNADLDAVSQALRVKDDRIISKGIKSVRSRVTNICDHLPGLTISAFISRLEEKLTAERGLARQDLTAADRAEIQSLRDSKYATWDWNYGYSPDYEITKDREFSSGTIKLHLEVHRGTIQSVTIRADFPGSGDLREMEHALSGVQINAEGITRALGKIEIGSVLPGLRLDDLIEILLY